MFAILGAILFFIIAVFTLLVACGAPLGEFTMGGQHRILPTPFRVMAGISLVVQLFAMVIVLQAGGWIPIWFSAKATQWICFFFAAYLTLNTIANAISKSKKERFVMTPLSLITAVCFWVTAVQM